LEPGANLGEFPRRKVNPVLLYLGARVLIVGTLLLDFGVLAQCFQFGRHLLDGVGEFGQLTGNGRYVLVGCDST
jgi:hypothetical protein